MVAELVDEDVLGERGVGRSRRLVVVDAAAAVLGVVDEDLEDVVRGLGRGVAQGAVVVREHVALRAEDVVLNLERRPPEDLRLRAVRAPFAGREVEGADVEVGLPRPERLVPEEGLDHPVDVGAELREVLLRVPFAEDEEIDLLRRRAAFEDGPDHTGLRRRRRVHVGRGGVDEGAPDLAEEVPPVALLQDDLHGAERPGESQRLAERPVGLPRLGGRLPLGVDRGVAARPEEAARRRVEDLEAVRPEPEPVVGPREAPGPGAVVHDAVDDDDLGPLASGAEEVDAHRLGGEVVEEGRGPRRRRRGGGRGEEEDGRGGGEGAERGGSRVSHREPRGES